MKCQYCGEEIQDWFHRCPKFPWEAYCRQCGGTGKDAAHTDRWCDACAGTGFGKWVCHECRAGDCACCVGVPCHCPCPTPEKRASVAVNYNAPTPETDAFMTLISDSEVDLGQVRAKLSTFEQERDQAHEEADRLRGLLYTAKRRLEVIIEEKGSHEDDCDTVRAMEMSAKDGLAELAMNGDFASEEPSIVELSEASYERAALRQDCVDACIRIAGDVFYAGLYDVTVGALEDAVTAAKKLEALDK
jgi:hypothetical protein